MSFKCLNSGIEMRFWPFIGLHPTVYNTGIRCYSAIQCYLGRSRNIDRLAPRREVVQIVLYYYLTSAELHDQCGQINNSDRR